VIELFVRGRRIMVRRDAETIGHACAGAGAQMRAAAEARSALVYAEPERRALEQVQALAAALREELVVWDVSTLRGRRAARRHGIRATPRVVYQSGPGERVDTFAARARALLRGLAVTGPR
jgi:hypothetical protein